MYIFVYVLRGLKGSICIRQSSLTFLLLCITQEFSQEVVGGLMGHENDQVEEGIEETNAREGGSMRITNFIRQGAKELSVVELTGSGRV